MTAAGHGATLLDTTVAAGDGWIGRLPAGSRLRIVDLHGNQAVDTLLYDADDPANRYSAVDTVREQGAVYLSTGSRLLSVRLDVLATIVADTCGRHDTLGGACAKESNVVRYGEHTRHQHACRATFLRYGHRYGLAKRDLTHNINFFMNVPLTPAGGLTFEDGVSAPGKHVELRAERDLLVLISNCPQLNNPCNGYDPTPIRLVACSGEPAVAASGTGPAPGTRPGPPGGSTGGPPGGSTGGSGPQGAGRAPAEGGAR